MRVAPRPAPYSPFGLCPPPFGLSLPPRGAGSPHWLTPQAPRHRARRPRRRGEIQPAAFWLSRPSGARARQEGARAAEVPRGRRVRLVELDFAAAAVAGV